MCTTSCARWRGGDRRRIPLEELSVAPADRDRTEMIALDAALTRLEAAHPRVGALVELRHFAGLTMEQAARTLGVGLSTAERDWRFGRTWLRRELDRSGAGEKNPKS